MSEVNMEMAKNVYESVCSVLDGLNLKYQKYEDDLVAVLSHRGDDMEHTILIAIEAEREVIRILEKLPIKMNPANADKICKAVCMINNQILIGKFSYDMNETVSCCINSVYEGCLISEAALKRMILTLAFTIEDFDDKFMALNKGYLEPEAFVKE